MAAFSPDDHRHADPRRADRSILEAWLGALPSPNTRAAYRSDLASFARWCDQNGATPLAADTDTLLAYRAAREAAGDGDATLRRKWSALSSYFAFAMQHNVVAANPTAGVARPRIAAGNPSPTPRLTPDAVATYRTLAAALDPRLDALVALLVVDGLKVSEALALDISDLRGRPPTMRVTIRRDRASRVVILDEDSARAVRRCAARRPAGPLFANRRTTESAEPERLTRFGADHLIRQLRGDGSAPITANALRRFHITHRHDAEPLEEIRKRAGLADVRSVRRYLIEHTER